MQQNQVSNKTLTTLSRLIDIARANHYLNLIEEEGKSL